MTPPRNLVEAVDQVGDGGLSGSRGPHEGDLLPRLGKEREAPRGRSAPPPPAKVNVIEAHVAGKGARPRHRCATPSPRRRPPCGPPPRPSAPGSRGPRPHSGSPAPSTANMTLGTRRGPSSRKLPCCVTWLMRHCRPGGQTPGSSRALPTVRAARPGPRMRPHHGRPSAKFTYPTAHRHRHHRRGVGLRRWCPLWRSRLVHGRSNSATWAAVLVVEDLDHLLARATISST